MKIQWMLRLIGAVAVIGLVSTAWVSTGQVAGAGDPAVTAAMGAGLSAYAVQEEKSEEGEEKEAKEEAKDVEYVGSKKCKMCHSKVYKSWEATTHYTGLDKLKPGEAKEAKEQAKLDVEKDYTTDKECLGCHVTGWGKPGGFELKDDKEEMEKMLQMHGHIGCEVCHGPGGKFIEFHKMIKKEKKEYTIAEMEEAGTISAGEEQCKACHNEKSPTYKGDFKFEEAVKTGIHEKPGLKQKKS